MVEFNLEQSRRVRVKNGKNIMMAIHNHITDLLTRYHGITARVLEMIRDRLQVLLDHVDSEWNVVRAEFLQLKLLLHYTRMSLLFGYLLWYNPNKL